jgi:hypothetical protein
MPVAESEILLVDDCAGLFDLSCEAAELGDFENASEFMFIVWFVEKDVLLQRFGQHEF